MNCNQRLSRALLLLVITATLTMALPSHLQAQTFPKLTVLVWSSEGNQIAGADENGYIHIWDILTGQALLEFQAHQGAIYSVSWSPDSSRLASTSPYDGLVRIWDTTNGNLIAELTGDRNPSDAALVAWNPNGTIIVSITANTDGGFPLRFWSAQDDRYQPLSMSASVAAFDIAWNSDGSILAVADYRAVYIFDDFSGNTLEPRSVIPFRFAIAWSPDGTKLAAANLDSTVQVLRVDNGEMLSSLGTATSETQQRAASVAWDTDGVRLIVDRFDGRTEIWDTATGQLLETLSLNRQGGRFLMALSPFGGSLALGNAAPVNEITSSQATKGVIQTLAGGAVQIVVPAPSLERLQAVADACNAPAAVEQLLPTSDAAGQLSAFVSSVEALPEDTIPPACAADLIAVASALQSR
jgi:WD40 repeat protein